MSEIKNRKGIRTLASRDRRLDDLRILKADRRLRQAHRQERSTGAGWPHPQGDARPSGAGPLSVSGHGLTVVKADADGIG